MANQNWWYPLEGTVGAAVTASNGTGSGTAFTDVIGSPAPLFVAGGFGGVGTAMQGQQDTGDVWLRRVFSAGNQTFLGSVSFYLPAQPSVTNPSNYLMRCYGGTNAGPTVYIVNPGSAAPRLVAQTRGSGAFVVLGDVYIFSAAERQAWYRVEMWADTGGSGPTAGAMRVRLYRASGSVADGAMMADRTFTGIDTSQNPTWQDCRFGTYIAQKVDDLLLMEGVPSSTEAWAFTKTANLVRDEPATLGNPASTFTRVYSATTLATNAVGSKTWSTPLTVADSSLVTPPANIPVPVGMVDGSTLTVFSGEVPAGSRVLAGPITSPASAIDNAMSFGTDTIPYPTPDEGTVIAAPSNPGGWALFPATSDKDISTGVDLTTLPTSITFELQPLSPRSPLNVQVDLCCAVAGTATATATVNGKSASSQVTGAGTVSVVVADVPSEGLDWRRIPVQLSVV